MAFVYVLKSRKDSRIYIGSTRLDINERINRHNNGQVQSTKYRRPLSLLHSEHFDDYTLARKKELYLKSGSGREHLNRILVKRAGTQVANPPAHTSCATADPPKHEVRRREGNM